MRKSMMKVVLLVLVITLAQGIVVFGLETRASNLAGLSRAALNASRVSYSQNVASDSRSVDAARAKKSNTRAVPTGTGAITQNAVDAKGIIDPVFKPSDRNDVGRKAIIDPVFNPQGKAIKPTLMQRAQVKVTPAIKKDKSAGTVSTTDKAIVDPIFKPADQK